MQKFSDYLAVVNAEESGNGEPKESGNCVPGEWMWSPWIDGQMKELQDILLVWNFVRPQK